MRERQTGRQTDTRRKYTHAYTPAPVEPPSHAQAATLTRDLNRYAYVSYMIHRHTQTYTDIHRSTVHEHHAHKTMYINTVTTNNTLSLIQCLIKSLISL